MFQVSSWFRPMLWLIPGWSWWSQLNEDQARAHCVRWWPWRINGHSGVLSVAFLQWLPSLSLWCPQLQVYLHLDAWAISSSFVTFPGCPQVALSGKEAPPRDPTSFYCRACHMALSQLLRICSCGLTACAAFCRLCLVTWLSILAFFSSIQSCWKWPCFESEQTTWLNWASCCMLTWCLFQ